jgi:hypothetical protein
MPLFIVSIYLKPLKERGTITHKSFHIELGMAMVWAKLGQEQILKQIMTAITFPKKLNSTGHTRELAVPA